MRPYPPELSAPRSRRALATLLLGLALPACEGGGGGPAPPTMTYEEYRDALEAAQCEWRARCKLEPSVEQCREWTFLDRADSYVVSALAAGTIVFHGDRAQGCVDEVAALTCDRDEPGDTPTCAEVLEGRVAPEEPCMIAAECALEGVCGKDPNCTEMCCPGECRVLPGPLAIGEDCTNTTLECEAGSYCKVDEMTFQRTVCTPKVAVGGFCADDFGFIECADEAYCDYNTGNCAERRPAGSPCEGEWDSCMAPARCEWNGATYLCFAPAELGAPCAPELGWRACTDVTAVCNDATRICETAPDVDQPCANYDCVGYAYCDEQTQLCRAFAALGEPCGFVDDGYYNYVPCGGALVCDASQVCVTPDFSADACPVPGMPYEAGE